MGSKQSPGGQRHFHSQPLGFTSFSSNILSSSWRSSTPSRLILLFNIGDHIKHYSSIVVSFTKKIWRSRFHFLTFLCKKKSFAVKTSRFPSNLRFEPNLVISLRAPAQTLNFQLDDHHHHDGDVKLAKSYHSTMCCVELYYSWLSFAGE